VLRIPLRMSDEACRIGDYHIHHEESYTFACYNRTLLPGAKKKDVEAAMSNVIEGHAMESGEARSNSKLSGNEISPIAGEKKGEGKQD